METINKRVFTRDLIIRLIFGFFEESPFFIVYKGADLTTLYWAAFFSLLLVNKAFLGAIDAKIG